MPRKKKGAIIKYAPSTSSFKQSRQSNRNQYDNDRDKYKSSSGIDWKDRVGVGRGEEARLCKVKFENGYCIIG